MDPVEKAINNVPSTKDIYSDIYNAKVFCHLWKDKIRWSKDYGGWFIFNGRFWQRDSNDAIKDYAIQTYAHMAADSEKLKDKKYLTHLKNSAMDQKLNAMLSCSKPAIGVFAEQWDQHLYLFNCTNGTINLNTGDFYPFKTTDLLTKTSGVDYDKFAVCPLWEKFLLDVFLGDKDVVEFMQTAIGYSLSGYTNEQCLFILYGSGRNGKSRFLQTVMGLVGDYGMNCPSNTFIRKQQAQIPNDIARLKGARMVTAIENNQNVSFDESMIKHITGEDKISARFLNKEFFDFTPTFKIFFATNHKPNIRGTDPGIWRRIKMVPFKFQVTDEMDDKMLGSKLREEAPGILNWALAGYARWKKEGLKTPDVIKRATESYKAEEDMIGQFIKDTCAKEEAQVIACKDFKDRLIEHVGFRVSIKQIAAYMESHGYKKDDNRAMVDGKTARVYSGLRWVAEHEKHENQGWQE